MATRYTSYNPLYEDDPKQAALKTRILTHMTADHAESLALYLRHYCKQPISLPPSPTTLAKIQLSDISLTHMIITHPGGRSLVPITPPMTSFSESRARLAQMHTDCLRALELSDLKIDEFVLPNKAWQWMLHALCLLIYITFSIYPSEAFLPEANTWGSWIWSIGGLAPWLAWLTRWLCKPTLIVVVVAHAVETVWFQRTRLRRYWIETGTTVWWLWIAVALHGGGAGIARFGDLVAERRKAKEVKEKSGQH